MPVVGDRVRFTYRNGKQIEGTLIKSFAKILWLYVTIRGDDGKDTTVCINDVDALCLETIETEKRIM